MDIEIIETRTQLTNLFKEVSKDLKVKQKEQSWQLFIKLLGQYRDEERREAVTERNIITDRKIENLQELLSEKREGTENNRGYGQGRYQGD